VIRAGPQLPPIHRRSSTTLISDAGRCTLSSSDVPLLAVCLQVPILPKLGWAHCRLPWPALIAPRIDGNNRCSRNPSVAAGLTQHSTVTLYRWLLKITVCMCLGHRKQACNNKITPHTENLTSYPEEVYEWISSSLWLPSISRETVCSPSVKWSSFSKCSQCLKPWVRVQ
jgi:hypothetical protein